MLRQIPSKGQLLIAKPSIIGDISFNRAVILLAEYNENGSVGFILNKPLEFTLSDFVPEINSDLKIYNGGPVEQDNLYFIHCVPELIPESTEISRGVYWGGNFETIVHLLIEKKLQNHHIRFFLGYSGWDKNQLEEEIAVDTWALQPNIYNGNIMKKTSSELWKEKMLELGGDYSLWSNAPENPNFN